MKRTIVFLLLLLVLLLLVAARVFFGGVEAVEPAADNSVQVQPTEAAPAAVSPVEEPTSAEAPETLLPAPTVEPDPEPTYQIATGNEAETFEGDFEPLPVQDEYVVDVQGEQYAEVYG